MSAIGREVGVVGEFAGPVGAAISVAVIIISQFVEAGLEVEKLAEHIKLTDQEKYELYWDFFFSVGIPRIIEADKKANEIYEQYISKVVGQYGHYDRITISLPSILVIEDKAFVRMITAPSRPKASLSVKKKHGMLVNVELPIPHVSSDISRIIPHTIADYKVICGPLDEDIVEKIIEKERERKGPVTFTREVKEWSLQEYPKNVTSCDGAVTYQKEKDTSSPSKILLYLSTYAARILADPEYDLVIYFAGKIIMSYLKDSSVHGVHEKYGAIHRYYFADQLLHCSVHNRMTNFFYITEKDNFFCSLRGSSDGQRNIVVTQGNFTDFENIHSVIGNNKTNYIEVSHTDYVDGKGGDDVITANNSATIRGYFGDSIHGNGLALLPMNFSDIDKMTYANNVTNIYNEGGEFISIDGQRSFKTADGLFVTPVPIRVGNETNTATNLHVIKRVDSNITLDDELNNLQEIDNSNFDITKQLLCPNSTSIISNAGNNIFYPDKEHHNFYWEASSDMRHLYLIDQRNANITIAQANGMLNFSQLNSTLDDVSFIENEQGEMKFSKDGLHVTLLPDYKNVTVTFDGKEYYKLQSGKLERDYCSHSLKIDGRLSVNGTDLLSHYNCFTFDSNKVLFFKLEDSLLLVSGKNTLLISAYYSSIHKDWNLSIKLNDRIIEPEKFRERADSPSAFRYYRPDERGLQIYHNQPTNEYQIGLMDLKNNSISDWNMRIIDEHLILSLKNRPIIQVKNWNIYPPAREIRFFFNDTVVLNEKCVASNCNPEDIIKEFEEEKAGFYKIIDTPLLSALREGDLDEFKSHFSKSPSTINDAVDSSNNTLLHYAAYFNKTEIAKFLLENNAEINVRNDKDLTPLDIAKKYVKPEMVKILEEEVERRKDVYPIRRRRHKQHHREYLRDGHRLTGTHDRHSIAKEAENSLQSDEIGYNREKATSGSSKPSSWINSLFGWVKESGELVSNVVTKFVTKEREGSKSGETQASSKQSEKTSSATLPNVLPSGRSPVQGISKENISNKGWSFSRKKVEGSSNPGAASPEGTSSTTSSISQVYAQPDINGLMLIPIFMTAMGKKFVLPFLSADQPISPLEADRYAFNIAIKFELALEQLASESDIQMHRLDSSLKKLGNRIIVNGVNGKIVDEITGKIVNGEYDKIPEILRSCAEKVLPGREAGCPGRLSQKKFDEFNNRLDVVINELMKQIACDRNVIPNRNRISEDKIRKKAYVVLRKVKVCKGISKRIGTNISEDDIYTTTLGRMIVSKNAQKDQIVDALFCSLENLVEIKLEEDRDEKASNKIKEFLETGANVEDILGRIAGDIISCYNSKFSEEEKYYHKELYTTMEQKNTSKSIYESSVLPCGNNLKDNLSRTGINDRPASELCDVSACNISQARNANLLGF